MNTSKDPRNHTIVARGVKFHDIDEIDGRPINTLGFKDLQFWDPRTEQWHSLSKEEDKFLITNEDTTIGWTEFWFRWKRYCLKRFHRPFIRIEATSTINP